MGFDVNRKKKKYLHSVNSPNKFEINEVNGVCTERERERERKNPGIYADDLILIFQVVRCLRIVHGVESLSNLIPPSELHHREYIGKVSDHASVQIPAQAAYSAEVSSICSKNALNPGCED